MYFIYIAIGRHRNKKVPSYILRCMKNNIIHNIAADVFPCVKNNFIFPSIIQLKKLNHEFAYSNSLLFSI